MHRRRALAATVPLAVLLALTGCTSSQPDTAAPSVAASDAATLAATDDGAEPAAVETEEPVATEPTADEFSQVVGGVLYQGTESAPVRIGTDTPGQEPAAQAGLERGTSSQWAQDNDKYLVYVFPTGGGWAWKVHGLSKYGSFRELSNNGYDSGNLFPDRASAITGPFTVDGRNLDRAEFILAAED